MKQVEYKIDNIKDIANEILFEARNAQIILFKGGLGAGKTTLIKEMVFAMGSFQVVTSPTFTYFNVYHAANEKIIYHFDLYRLKSITEFEMAGFFEYLYQPNTLVFIEWPEIIEDFLSARVFEINLQTTGLHNRLMQYFMR